MGFCRTMTTSFYYQSWPEWFREKYADDIEFLGSLSLPVMKKRWARLPARI